MDQFLQSQNQYNIWFFSWARAEIMTPPGEFENLKAFLKEHNIEWYISVDNVQPLIDIQNGWFEKEWKDLARN